MQSVLSGPQSPAKEARDEIVMRHRLGHAEAVVCADGTASLLNVSYAVMPEGVRIIGNGTLPHPLDVELSPVYKAAPDLLEALARLRSYIATDERGHATFIVDVARGQFKPVDNPRAAVTILQAVDAAIAKAAPPS